MRAAAAAMLLAAGLSTPAATEPERLTLACTGTMANPTTPDDKPVPVSMGIVVNFTTRSVHGFNVAGLADFPVKIVAINDAIITFFGSDPDPRPPIVKWTISGSIDRVTGDVGATSAGNTDKIATSTTYQLKCKPAERMF
jgi:hypothetical protein